MLREEIDKKIIKDKNGMWIDTELKTTIKMECDVREILSKFMETQKILNHLFAERLDLIDGHIDKELSEQYNVNDVLHDEIAEIYGELDKQDEVNEVITDCLAVMTERMNGIENRLNKLEKEKRRNATNK